MKKLYIYILLSVLFAGFFGCEDYDDFSKLHELTDDELAEIARQDSIAQAEKERINADLVLDYTLEITTSASAYDGAPLTIEVDKIAELFGISEAEVLAGIAGESGAPEINGFAIEGTTHADVAGASNTNAPWGHWWDVNGDVTAWGDDAMLFAEFDTETGVFAVGQYPGHLVDGDTITFIEALKYNELRLAVRITVYPKAAGQITAPVVSTQDLNIEVTAKSSYDADSIQFDLDAVLSGLGVSSMEEVTYLGVNEDGSYNQEPVTNNGFWYDINGFVGAWGDDASVFTEYYTTSPGWLKIGQYPDHLTAGMSFVIKYGFMANNKIVMLNITINIQGYVDPETPPAGEPEALTIDVELAKPYSNDYASVSYDVRETLRNAFKMTTYQIHQAISTGELKLYQGEVSETDPVYTADAPGYWLKEDGTAGEWAESVVWTSLAHSETELYIFGGNHPDNAVEGATINSTYIATCNGGSVTINLTFKVEEDVFVDPETPPTGDPVDMTIDLELSKAYSNDYASVTFNLQDTLREAFKMTTYQIHKAIESGDLKLYQGEVSEETPAYTAEAPGFWLNAEGAVVEWAEGMVWSSIGHTNTELYLFGGNHPDNAAAGTTVTSKLIAICNGGTVTINLTFKVE